MSLRPWSKSAWAAAESSARAEICRPITKRMTAPPSAFARTRVGLAARPGRPDDVPGRFDAIENKFTVVRRAPQPEVVQRHTRISPVTGAFTALSPVAEQAHELGTKGLVALFREILDEL